MKSNGTDQRTLALCFGQFGPYHHARVAALQRAAAEQGVRVVPVQVASATSTYEWKSGQGAGSGPSEVVAPSRAEGLKTLCEGVEEAASPLDVFLKARKLFREEKVDVAFLPSYSPARFFALFAAAKSLGIRTVMMNESHAGTEQATGWKRWIKRQIVKQFDAALVGGEPHKRHFASLGIPADKIFTGYDAVDNAHFAAKADEVRKKSDEWRVTCDELGKQSESLNVREAYGLPERYFLSLGRMVEKKNLAALVAAYARYAEGVAVAGEGLKVKGNDGEKRGAGSGEHGVIETTETRHTPVALVFVGSGELEGALREQARGLGLRVVDRTDWRVNGREEAQEGGGGETVFRKDGVSVGESSETRDSFAYGPSSQTPVPATSHEENCGTVFFYGFRQIEENPVFYALAEAFVLPSLKEEWGLVVNEAMACSLPVIVSRTAGCAEDLLPGSGQVTSGEWRVTSKNADDSLEERSNGFVFDPKSSDALSEALCRIADYGTTGLQDDGTSTLAKMGKRSREIVANFSCENFAQQALRAAEVADA